MTHEDLFQEFLTRDRGRIADWATWLAETEAAIERRLENALEPQAHALHGEPVYLNGEVVDVNGAEERLEHLGDCVDAVCGGRAVDDPLALADDEWTDDEELRPFEPAATDEGVRRYELVIGEFVQAERETIATGDGHCIVLEPGTYPVLTVTSRAVADRIDAAAIAVHGTNERGDREQILIPATAEQLRAYVQAGALRLDVPESLLEPQARHEFDVKQYPGFIFSGPTRNPALVDLAVLRRSGSTPTVIATERDDNPGISITNGAEQLAAQVLTRVVPERAGDSVPFRLVVHHRSASFAVGDRDFEALEATFHEVRFADFQVRENGNGVPRIGDAVEWRNLDERIAEALSEQKTLERSADDGPDAGATALAGTASVKRDLELPKEVGTSRWHPLALLSMPLVILATNVVATQVVAARMGYNPTLGRPFAHVAGVSLYAPWAWLPWAWRFLEPLGGYDYQHHIGRWPAVVYAGLWALPYILLGGFFALFLVPAIVQLVLTRPSGKVEQLVDSAHFAEAHELRDLLEAEAGPVIGSFRGRLLRYAKALGINYTGPSGDGKSAFLLISNLLTSLRDPRAARWDATKRRTETWGEEPSFVVFDPTGEVFEKTARFQREVLGKRIYRLDPLSNEPGLSRFNPVWSIELGTEREQQGCRRLMADIIDPQGKGLTNFWDRQSSTFAEAVLAKVGYRSLHRNDPRLFSLPGMIDYIDSFEKLKDLCDDMMQTADDPHGVFGWTGPDGKPTKVRTWIANAANTMKGMAAAPETQRNVFDSVVQHLAIYRDEGPLRRNARESTFTFSAIANEPQAAVVYIAAHPLDIPTLQQYLRTVTRAALREIVSTTDTVDGRTVRGNLRSTIIALDEVAVLGRLDELELLGGYLRKFGVMLWLLWQQTSQLARLYPEESFTENLGVHIMGRSNTPKAAKAIAESAGQSSTTLTRRNVSGDRWTPAPLGQVNEHVDIITRELMTTFEQMNLPVGDVLIRCDGRLIQAQKHFFFDDPVLKRLAKMGGVKCADVGLVEPPYHSALRVELGPVRFAKSLTPAPRPPAKTEKPTDGPNSAEGAISADALQEAIAAALERDPVIIRLAKGGKTNRVRR